MDSSIKMWSVKKLASQFENMTVIESKPKENKKRKNYELKIVNEKIKPPVFAIINNAVKSDKIVKKYEILTVEKKIEDKVKKHEIKNNTKYRNITNSCESVRKETEKEPLSNLSSENSIKIKNEIINEHFNNDIQKVKQVCGSLVTDITKKSLFKEDNSKISLFKEKNTKTFVKTEKAKVNEKPTFKISENNNAVLSTTKKNEVKRENEIDLIEIFDRNLESIFDIREILFYIDPLRDLQYKTILTTYDQIAYKPPSLSNELEWCRIIGKIHFNLLANLKVVEQKLQEARFELITFEWAYLKMLRVLKDHFLAKTELHLFVHEFTILYKNIKEIISYSEQFMKAADECWQRDILLKNFSRILLQYIEKSSATYVYYCANQIFSEALLEELINDPERSFKSVLIESEKEDICKKVSFITFLQLPIKQIHHFPILLKNIFQYITPEHPEYYYYKETLVLINKVLEKCSSEVKISRKDFAKQSILDLLRFPKNMQLDFVGTVALHTFIKCGEVKVISFNNELFKIQKTSVHLFLFNDILVITKLTDKNKFEVINYYYRINLKNFEDQVTISRNKKYYNMKNVICISITENINGQFLDSKLMLECLTETDKLRWMAALDPPDTTPLSNYHLNLDIKKRVVANTNYNTVQADELNLQVGDIIDILQESADGWYFGKNSKTNETGWLKRNTVID